MLVHVAVGGAPLEPLVPELPLEPLVPELPLVPLVPLVPELPLVPLVPLVPELPEVPLEPELPLVPELPLDPVFVPPSCAGIVLLPGSEPGSAGSVGLVEDPVPPTLLAVPPYGPPSGGSDALAHPATPATHADRAIATIDRVLTRDRT